MCGIFGGIEAELDERAVERLAHRGPDQHAVVREPTPWGTLTLGQTRLAVVDHRPIDLPTRIGEAAIVYNGEVYNWRALRKELEAEGVELRTQTDGEVVLAAYLRWGPACLDRMNGMFAFAIWDGRRLFCARDRLGKKPFFYRTRGHRFDFASEVKAFDELEFVGDELFELLEFCVDERTPYRGVHALAPGQYLSFEPASGELVVRRWWELPRRAGSRLEEPEVALERFVELFEDAVRLRLDADVPVSLFLSGGIDSSLVAAVAARIGKPFARAYTCQFDELRGQIDEEPYARDLAARLGLELAVISPTRAQFFEDLPRLAYHLEIPTGSLSVFPLYRLAKAAHDDGYRVVLSGEGSDELFCGYARNELLLASPKPADDPRTQSYAAMLRRFEGSDLARFCRMASRSGLAGAALLEGYLAHLWSPQRSAVENVCHVETRIFLQPLLQMADRMSMAHGVEARNPFLDYRIVELAFSLEDSLKLRGGVGKGLVKAAAQRLLPPGSLVLERPVKHGLPTPINLWLHGHNSFDRKHWNALMTTECIQTLQRRRDEAPGR
jgi:asparagine synthase (glutamine-hydrolysing)